MKNQYSDFVASELNELETRDVDQLFECLKDNLTEMKATVDETDLYSEIERQVGAKTHQTKHTPGPWFAEGTKQYPEVNSIMLDENRCPTEYRICSVHEREGNSQIANARLIAAAPELLEALREAMLVLSVSRSPETPHRRNAEIQAERAIFKATGGTK